MHRTKHPIHFGCLLLFILCVATKCVRLETSQLNPKQEDNLSIKITAKDSSKRLKVDYNFGGLNGTTTNVPLTATKNTSKNTGN